MIFSCSDSLHHFTFVIIAIFPVVCVAVVIVIYWVNPYFNYTKSLGN